MNKLLIVIIVALLIGTGAYLFLKRNSMNTSSSQTTVTNEPNTVTIQNFAFNPGTLTVKTGTTVTWVNSDSTTHTIKADTFNSDPLNTNDKFTFTFNTPGTYNYTCGIHPSMKGTIVVQ